MIKLAAGYVRRSSHKQQDNNSIEIQIQNIKEFAIRHNMDVPDELIFIEDVTSAFNTIANKRKELMRLSKKMLELNISTVIFYETSRMDRTGYSFILDFYRPLLEKMPELEVYTTNSTKPLNPDSPEVKLNFLISQIESEMKSERAIGSLKCDLDSDDNIRPGSKIPYGYTQINKKLYPNEEAEVVSLIFFLYSWGYSLVKISDLLNEANISSPQGKLWQSGTINKMIKNPVYTGNLSWTIHKMKSDNNHYFFKDTHQAIVDDFSIQLHKLNQRLQQQYGRIDTPFLFLKKVKCNHCHQVLNTQNGSTKRNGVKYVYQHYVCRTCNYKIDAEEIHKVFLPLVKERVYNLVSQDSIKRETLEFLTGMTTNLQRLFNETTEKIAILTQQKQLAQELEDRELELYIEDLINHHQKVLKNQQNCLENVVKTSQAVDDGLFFSRFENLFYYELGEIEKRLIILYFVDYVSVTPDSKKNIYFKANIFDELTYSLSK